MRLITKRKIRIYTVLLSLFLAWGSLPALAQSGSRLGSSGSETPALGNLSGVTLDSPSDRARLLEERNVELLGTGPVDPDVYVLGPGDLLGLEIVGAFSLSAEDIVGADGRVVFPQIGALDLSGKTLSEARDMIGSKTGRMIRGSDVSLLLRSTRAFKVYVVGRVGSPGAVRATAMMRLSEAIQAAGGFEAAADVRNIQILYANGETKQGDLLSFLLHGDTSANPTLLDGAVINVQPTTHQIEVVGSVMNPGPLDFVEGESARDLLEMIGLSPQADLSNIRIHSFSSGTDYTETLLGEGEDQTLKARDRILVRGLGDWDPEASVEVKGAVKFPGPHSVKRNDLRVADVVQLAGGALEDAVLSRVVLNRSFDPDSVRVTDPVAAKNYVANLTSYRSREVVVDLSHGEGPFVQPGDVISVPREGGFVHITGQVKVPGYYDHQPGWEPKDYIKAAGGFARLADKKGTRVTRGNHGDVLFAQDMKELAAGDMVWVPERPPISTWQLFKDLLSITTQALSVYLLVRETTN
ncbi:MAG: hypothetical protein HKN21_09000 [Candidatus Eisenbacteria bacterium]|uniref:Polysaccharide export protein n=1 Tax=Eiseniibacteriota bacterium TaxID=2212470 RepID=A0A7Y2E810_UNCEI|nr:hypothetical protein [Candidatus Eisenbacteria bacterium]